MSTRTAIPRRRPGIFARVTGAAAALALVLLASGLPREAHAAPPPFRLPQPVVRTLPNGITVAVFRDTRLPLAQVQLTVVAGSAAEGSLPPGVAYLTSQMIGQSSASRDPLAMQEDLDRCGGQMSARIGRDVGVVTASFLSAELPAGLELVADAVQNALLTDADFDRARRGAYSLTTGLAGAAREPEDRLWRGAFGDGPYGHEPAGTKQSLEGMTLADVRAFYAAHWGPAGAVLAVAGDVQPDSVFAVAQDAFGSWPARPASAAVAPAPPPARAMHLVSRPDAGICEVWVGVPGPRAGDPDEVAIAIAGQLAARATSGLSDVNTGQSALRSGGFVWMAASSSVDSAAIVAKRLELALTSLRTAPPSGQEVASLEQAVLSSFPMRFETIAGLTDQWSAEAALGRGFDDLVAFPAAVHAVTAAGISAAARRWFDPAHMTFVVAGPLERLRKPLATVAPIANSGSSEDQPVTPALEKAGRELVTQAVAAHGGLAALRKVKDSVLEGDATIELGGREATAKVLQTRQEPDRMVYDLHFGEAGTRQVLNGLRGWSAPIDTLPQVHEADSSAVAALRLGFRTDVVHVLLDAADPAARRVSRGRESVNGGIAEKVEIWAPNGSRRTLFFDPGTHLLAGVELHEAGEHGGGQASRRWYRDYRAVNGIRLPFAEDRWLGGQRVMKLQITRYELNSGVPESLFQRPEAPLPPSSR